MTHPLPPRPAAAGAHHDAVGVPDVPDAVLGWRTWRIGRRAQRRAELIAPLAGSLWPARRPLVASCGSRDHSPPGDHCRCGLYAVADPRVLEWGPSEYEVLGAVALWGQVVEGTRGWRASHGYPRFLVTGPVIPTEQRAALSRRYGVPVLPSAIPPRDLARLLGARPGVADNLLRRPTGDLEDALAARMPGWADEWRVARTAPAAPRRRFPTLTGTWRRR